MKASFRIGMTVAVAVILLLSFASGAVSQSASSSATWGNYSSRFRTPFVVANPSGSNLMNAPVLFYLHFPWGEVVNAANELAIQNSTGATTSSSVLCQTVQQGFVVGACVMMIANVTGASATYYAYYGNPTAPEQEGAPAPPGLAGASAARFSGLDLNYTFLSTYGINFSSYVSMPGAPNEGNPNLGGYSYDRIVSPWHFLGSPFSNSTTAIAAASANDSGVLILRTMIGTSSSLRLIDLIVNQRATAVNSLSVVDYYNLADLDRVFPGSGLYNSSLGEFTYASPNAAFELTSNPAPYPVEVGSAASVLNDTRTGNFSPIHSASGAIGMANVHTFSSVQPYGSQEVARSWTVAGMTGAPLPFVASFGTPESLGAGVPAVFAGYSASFSLNQSIIDYESQPRSNLTLQVAGPNTISIPGSPTFSGPISYTAPSTGSQNFTDPTAWSARATPIPGVSAVASDKYYSVSAGNYTGIVSITASNISSKLPSSGSATLTTVPLDILDFQGVTLHLTYRAVDSISSPNNRTSLYFAVGTQGPAGATYYFPVPGLSAKTFHGPLIENLTADGQWHQLTSNLGAFLPSHVSLLSLMVNATATNSENGGLQLQVTDAYISVNGSASSMLGGSLAQRGNGGSVTVALASPEVSILGNATMQIPFWVAGSPETTTGESFAVSFPGVVAGLYKGTNLKLTYVRGTSLGESFLILGPNSSLSSAVLNGNGTSPTQTNGGYVITQTTNGANALTLNYNTVPYKVAIVDAGGKPLSAGLSISDELGNILLVAQIPASGTTLHLIPGTYVLSTSFDNQTVASSVDTISAANQTTIRTSVFEEGFRVTNVLGSPIPYAQVTLQLQGATTNTGTTDGSGTVYFEMVQNAPYTIRVSSGGSVLSTQSVSPNVNGALITIQTGYAPPSIIEFAVLLIAWIVGVVALVPRLLRRRTSLAPSFPRRNKE